MLIRVAYKHQRLIQRFDCTGDIFFERPSEIRGIVFRGLFGQPTVVPKIKADTRPEKGDQ
jgi:hypothetical protein